MLDRRVLVVDDEPDFQVTYERLLGRQGLRVVTAGSRHEGLALVERGSLVLVIADLRLYDGDGLDVVRAARQACRSLPVIVITGFGSESSRLAALHAGASAYLTKPFTAAAFASLVAETLGSRKGGCGSASSSGPDTR
ncbi:MAG: response regulator [Candidatus Rokubacteria bacterium]|nr:response regulator [Candidatus Rokubacteria bacterium]